jgi:hypothetical protein
VTGLPPPDETDPATETEQETLGAENVTETSSNFTIDTSSNYTIADARLEFRSAFISQSVYVLVLLCITALVYSLYVSLSHGIAEINRLHVLPMLLKKSISQALPTTSLRRSTTIMITFTLV